VSRQSHFAERDICRLLTGSEPGDARLAALLPLVRALRGAAARRPSDEAARSFARRAAQLTHLGTRDQMAGRPRAVPWSSRTRTYARLAGAMAALVLMLAASAGVAYAADASVPGDPLHSLDLAMENLGIGNGGLPERLSEAGHLVQGGKVGEGLIAAAEAISADGGPTDAYARQAADALLAAAELVASSGGEGSAAVRVQVAETLRFMATTDLTGNEFGRAVSELARRIGAQGSTEDTGTTPTTKRTTPANSEAQPPDPEKGNGKNR
jgi:hypothetical protein